MASINRLVPGQIVYSIERQKMGNTTIKYNALYTVRIVEVNTDRGFVMASWNGNPPKEFYERGVKKKEGERT
jgi:hypothetical protein